MIAVVNYGAGNLGSVANALGRLGAEYTLASDPAVIRAASHVILPGVGEASSAMAALRDNGLAEVLRRLAQPVLGICIGMQLMCRRSEEGAAECLGIFGTDVRRLDPAGGLKVPHMGWNTVENLCSPLFAGLDEGTYFYYVHSYAPAPCPHTIATTVYGNAFSAALRRGNFYGVQFHPEKSGQAGARLIANFLYL